METGNATEKKTVQFDKCFFALMTLAGHMRRSICRNWTVVAWSTFLILILVAEAFAADPESDCSSPDPDRQLKSCTALIESGRLDTNTLSQAYNKRGVAFVMKGRLEQAFADFSAAIRANPRDPKPYVNRGGVHMQWNQLIEAKFNFDTAIRLKPDFARAYANRGLIYLLNEQYRAALDDMNNAIRFDPACALNYNNRGVAYENLGERSKAIADFRKALELDPDLGVAKINFMRLTRGASAEPEPGSRMGPSIADIVPELQPRGVCPT